MDEQIEITPQQPSELETLETLKAELERTKQQLRAAHETRCAEELQLLLARRNCSLGPGPDGRLAVIWNG